MAIDKPSEHFNTVLYTGTGTFPQSISGVGFQPDFIWIKRRNAAASHVFSDVIRGVTKTIYSDSMSEELTNDTYGWVSAFDTDGFSVNQAGSSGENVNATGSTYVSWNWKAGGTAVSNTSGSITSSVSANTTAGFSIVNYTGNQISGATVGHGLSQAPDMVLIKQRTTGGHHWKSIMPPLGAGKALYLNLTNAQATGEFANTLPSATVFTLDADTNDNESTATHIAYAFHSVKGYSKIGTYTGNGNADGTFVYTGFKPAWVMIKMSSSTSNWTILDNVREGYNVDNEPLYANTTSAEGTTDLIDILSNGFKLRSSDASINTSGGTYIYMAFASSPFVTSTGIPCTAR